MMRHYPYRREERSHYRGIDYKPGSAIDSAWESIQHDARLADVYAKRKSGEIPWIDPLAERLHS